MKCPECIGSNKREATHEVTLPVVEGATNPRVVLVCYYHASGYEMVEGATIRRVD